MEASGLLMTQGRTIDNADYLAPTFMSAMDEAYGGTRLGRQELSGEFIEDLPGALWTRDMLEGAFTPTAPEMSKIILAIDPPVTSGTRSDACGLVVAGVSGGQSRRGNGQLRLAHVRPAYPYPHCPC